MLTYSYDGALLTSQAITGTINASVNSAYDNNFRVKSLAINSQDAINFSYDHDGLLTKAGELTLNRATNNGFLTGTRLDTLNDTYSYNAFGEVADYQALNGSDSLAHWTYQRDALGRITQQCVAKARPQEHEQAARPGVGDEGHKMRYRMPPTSGGASFEWHIQRLTRPTRTHYPTVTNPTRRHDTL